MTRHVLIGAGGSGQHIVHAYLKLLALSSPAPALVPHVFIVDADASEGSAAEKRSTLIRDIQALHASLTRGVEDPALYGVIEPHAGGEAAHVTLGRLIGVVDAPKLKPLAHAFLADDADEWGNDWEIELGKGMMANPKVGSIAMAHKVASETGPGSKLSQLGEILSVLGRDVRVAIVGSNFGGTGSGVIPTLVREFDQHAESVRAFLTLPWFTITPSRNQARVSAALDVGGVDPKQRNASLGLHAYFDELAGVDAGRRKLNRSAYVLTQSMDDWKQASREDDGNYDQREHKHVLNLLQACAVQSFLGMGVGGAPNKFLYSLKTTTESERSGRFAASMSSHLRFWVGENDSRQLTDLVNDAEAVAFVLDRAGQILKETRDGVFKPPSSTTFIQGPDFVRFVENLMRACGLDFASEGFWLWKKKYIPDKVYADLGKAMCHCAIEIRRWLVWVDAHTVEAAGKEAGHAAGVVGCNRAHLFETEDGGSIPDDKAQERWQQLGVKVVAASGEDLAKSPVGAQALRLLMQLFEPKEGATPLGKQSFEEQLKRESDHDVSSVAARLITQALHAQVVTLRTTRDDAFRRDDQQSQGDEGANADTGLPMLKFGHLTGKLIDDVRLVRIDLNKLVQENQDYLSWSHPLTRACLDPYTGVVLGRDGRLDISALLTIEHSLRGIPNIAAPQLVQRWRLEKCRPRRTAGETSRAYEDVDGTFRTQQPGIFLHARRVIEAALWLIVSADRRVVFVDNLLGRGDASPFESLVRKELDIGDGRLAALVFAPKEKFAGRPIFVWDGSTWFLAANTAARAFFRSLLPQLPTVKRHYRADNVLFRLGQPNSSEEDGTYKYFACELRTALRSLRGVDDETLASLRTALDETLAELPEVLDTEENQYRGQAFDLWLKSGGVGSSSLSVAPHRMLSDANEFVCSPPVVFYADSDGSATPRWNGVMPFRAAAWEAIENDPDPTHLDARLKLERIDSHEATRRIDKYTLALHRVLAWELDLKGSGKTALADPFGTEPLTAVQQELSWSFGIWPNFIADKWNYYIISGTPQIGRSADVELPWLNPKLTVELVVWGRAKDHPDGRLTELGRVVNGLSVRIEGRPEILEIVVGGNVLGSRRIKLKRLDSGDHVDMIGIDFGTSNSCVAVQERFGDPSSRHIVPLVPGGIFRNKDSRTEPLLHFMSSADTPRAQNDFQFFEAVFFHVKNATIKDGSGDTLPSELLVSLDDRVDEAKRQKPALSAVYAKEALPLHEASGLAQPVMLGGFPLASPLLTPLAPQPYKLEDPPEFFGWLRDMVQGDGRLFGDLKWPRAGDKGNYLESRSLRAIYLEHTIVAALAILRSQGWSKFGRFVATQPEALVRLKNTFADTFAEDLGRIVRALAQRTGMGTGTDAKSPYEVKIVSETEAALRMVGLDAQHSKKSVLTIDIGGGTTDVGVSLRSGANGGAAKPESFTASAQFAGNRLLEAIARTPDAREWFKNMFGSSEKYSVDVAMSLIKANLRAGTPVPNGELPASLTAMFFDAIYEYAFNILRMFVEVNAGWRNQFLADTTQRIKVVLLGNGFKLYAVFQEEGYARTLADYNLGILKRLVDAGTLDPEIAKRIDFDVRDTGKTGLIADGGFDAAEDSDNFARRAPSILLPRGLRSSNDEGQGLQTDGTTLITADAFRREWVGLNGAGAGASRKIWFEHDRQRIAESFPLTHAYWNGSVEDFDNVFRVGKNLSEQYMDAGALYLVGVPQAAAHSFVRLLGERAEQST